MKILITGATGLVGTALATALPKDGHMVCRLIRPSTKTPDAPAGTFDVQWNPQTGELGGAAVGAEVVVNLAGAPVTGGRWTAARKKILRASRIDATRALVNALEKMNAKPDVLISASAIGYYGNRGDEILTEESDPGTEFLALLAKDWEAEALRAEAFRTRVVLARFGIILAKLGGALPAMMAPFKFGVGGRIGTGGQWTSWIALEDVIEIIRYAINNRAVHGPINVVSPEPVTNSQFAKTLAAAMHRPAILPAPAFALRALLGKQMADEMLLASQRVLPNRLDQSGYVFKGPNLGKVLHNIASAG